MTLSTETANKIESLSVSDFLELLESLNDEDGEYACYLRYATDLELFSRRFFPHYCKHPFNEFHRDYFTAVRFGERKVRRVYGAPRGYAKSTLVALIKPIHDLCYGLENFIVLFSNGDKQALGKLREIRNELLTNRDLVDFYRIRFRRKNVAEGSFEVFSEGRSCRFEAYGSGAQVRGIRHGAARPSKIVFDDVEHSEEVENEAIRAKYVNWYQEDVVKLGDESTNIEGVGTVLHKKALLVELIENPVYESNVYKAVQSWADRQDLWDKWRQMFTNLEMEKEERLAASRAFYREHEAEMLKGAKVLWPEKEPYLALMEEMVEGGRRAFMKEKQNEPLGSDEKVFDRFHWYRDAERDGKPGCLVEATDVFIPLAHMRAYGVMDPATGQTKARPGKKGDFTCLVSGLTDQRGRLFVHRDWTKRAAPSDYIQQIFIHHDEWKYEKFGVETNLYRNLLLPNIVDARKAIEAERKKSIRLPLYDIENVENKEKRIYTLEPKVTNGYILLNRALSPEFKGQLEDFPKADHDDCPDALQMLWGMINNQYRMTPVGVDAMRGY